MASALRSAGIGAPILAGGLLAAVVPAAGEGLPALLVAAGLAVVAAGLAAAVGRDLPAIAQAALAMALIAAGAATTTTGGDLARGVAIAGAALVLPLAGASLIRSRELIALALAGGLLSGPVRALVYDPFLDASCAGCRPSGLAVAPHLALARPLHVAGVLITVAALLLAARGAAHRLPVILVAAAAAATTTGLESELLLVAGTVVAVLACVGDCVTAIRARGRIERLLTALRDRAELAATLRDALGDPALSVAYWLEDERRFVAADGGSPPAPLAAQTATDLRVGGRLAARVHHRAGAAGVAEVAAALDAPARLVLENERLAARLAARLAELASSRARIVARADAERRQIERDVHDGAQQHVLALGFDLRVALAALPADDPDRPALEECLAETMRALDDLRELSHGLYPASLASSGLAPALRAMARRATTAVELQTLADGRLPPTVEQVAYALVADAVTRAPDGIAVSTTVDGPDLSVQIEGAAGLPAGVLVDRVAAVGGRLVPGDGRIVAVLPCA